MDRGQELISVAWSGFPFTFSPARHRGRTSDLVCSCVMREVPIGGITLPVSTDSLMEGEKLRGSRCAPPHPHLSLVCSPGDHALSQGAACSLCCTDAPWPWCFADKTMGVFHLQSPRKKYDFTYEQAQAACAAEGASLATFQQLSAAQQVGAGAGSIALWGGDMQFFSLGPGQR